ncbi:hypothetical protein SDC9_69380 [bioreactor metagenome]|uniref:Uncharacterized protein n=1 Tax=bioreactor metagenome TaxID=1076179 RepID=A0A644Y303_9ZZZZ
MLQKFQHGRFQLRFPHLPVGDGNAHLRQELLNLSRHGFHALHAVIDHIRLPFSRKFTADGVLEQRVRVFQNIGLHGITRFRRRFNHADIAYPRHGHVQRPRNRRGGQCEHVHGSLECFDLLFVVDPETVFLIDDQ